MTKIDFFGGFNGQYLELLVNVFICQNNFDLSQPIFNETIGSCHLKNKNPSYKRIIRAYHYSARRDPFDENDKVIKIVPTVDDMLIGITNRCLRAGDAPMDLEHLEIDTTQKLQPLTNGQRILQALTSEYGSHHSYPRKILRKHFGSMFVDRVTLNDFSPEIKCHYDFPYRALFDTSRLFFELAGIAKFLELDFCPTEKLMQTHNKFLQLNQGYHSEIKCHGILEDIWAGRSTAIDLNIVEEAWINWQIARALPGRELPLLFNDHYPTNTLEISTAIFQGADGFQ